MLYEFKMFKFSTESAAHAFVEGVQFVNDSDLECFGPTKEGYWWIVRIQIRIGN